MTAYIIRRILFMIPDDFRHHAGVVRRGAVRAGRPGRAHHRAAARAPIPAPPRAFPAPPAAILRRDALQSGGQHPTSPPNIAAPRGSIPTFIKSLEKQFGFDKPAYERFFIMMWNYLRFDFGKSYFRDVSVIELIKEKLPVSISLGIWMTLMSYLISIPLGIRKAVRDGSQFDVWTSGVIIVGYAIPGFLFAILLIVLFAGGSFWQIFPLRGLTSEGWSQFPWWEKILDYFWHLDAADRLDGAGRLRHHDAADQELVPRGNAQAICADRARQGLHRAAGAVRPYLPQRHAVRDRRLSRRLRPRLLRRLAV